MSLKEGGDGIVGVDDQLTAVNRLCADMRIALDNIEKMQTD